jgi:hypothetical protein
MHEVVFDLLVKPQIKLLEAPICGVSGCHWRIARPRKAIGLGPRPDAGAACLFPDENADLDARRYIVATNYLRNA